MSDIHYVRDTICAQSRNIGNGESTRFLQTKGGFLKIESDHRTFPQDQDFIQDDFTSSPGNKYRHLTYGLRFMSGVSYNPSDWSIHTDTETPGTETTENAEGGSDFLNDRLVHDDLGSVSGGSRKIGAVDHREIKGGWKLLTGLDMEKLAIRRAEEFVKKEVATANLRYVGQDLERLSDGVRRLTRLKCIPRDDPSLGGELHTEANPLFPGKRHRGNGVWALPSRKVVGYPGECPVLSVYNIKTETYLIPFGTRWKKTEEWYDNNGQQVGTPTKWVTTWKLLDPDRDPEKEITNWIPLYHNCSPSMLASQWRFASMPVEIKMTKVYSEHPDFTAWMSEGGSWASTGESIGPHGYGHYKIDVKKSHWTREAMELFLQRWIEKKTAMKSIYFKSLYCKKNDAFYPDLQSSLQINKFLNEECPDEYKILGGGTQMPQGGTSPAEAPEGGFSETCHKYSDQQIFDEINRMHERYETSHASKYRYQFYFTFVPFSWYTDSLLGGQYGGTAEQLETIHQQMRDHKISSAMWNNFAWKQVPTGFSATGNDTIILESFVMTDPDGDAGWCWQDIIRTIGEYVTDLANFEFDSPSDTDMDDLIVEYWDKQNDVYPQGDSDDLFDDTKPGWQRIHEGELVQASGDYDDDDLGSGPIERKEPEPDACFDDDVACITKRFWHGCTCPYSDLQHENDWWPCC